MTGRTTRGVDRPRTLQIGQRPAPGRMASVMAASAWSKTSTGAGRNSARASSTVPVSHVAQCSGSTWMTASLSCLSAGSFGSGLCNLASRGCP